MSTEPTRPPTGEPEPEPEPEPITPPQVDIFEIPSASRRPNEELLRPIARQKLLRRLADEQALRERSTKAAENAARWARISVLVAVAALAIAAWPMVQEWFRR